MALANSVNSSLVGVTGTGSYVGSNSPSLTTPRMDSLYSATNPGAVLNFVGFTSAVNYWTMNNSATGNGVGLSAGGTDTNINGVIGGKGTGSIWIKGGADGTPIPAGYVGEVLSSLVPTTSAVTMVSGTPVNVTSVTLTPGRWLVFGNVWNVGATSFSNIQGWINTVSATNPNQSMVASSTATQQGGGRVVPGGVYNVTTNTPVYLSSAVASTGGTPTVCGQLFAIRLP